MIEGGLRGYGRVSIDGLLTGEISVGLGTTPLTLIHIIEGIGSAGDIVINDTEGDYDANGVIHIGESPVDPDDMPDVTFDGSILIKKESGGGGGGDLNGDIRVAGCHATADDLNICICGTINGQVSIKPTNCSNQVSYSCVSGCP